MSFASVSILLFSASERLFILSIYLNEGPADKQFGDVLIFRKQTEFTPKRHGWGRRTNLDANFANIAITAHQGHCNSV